MKKFTLLAVAGMAIAFNPAFAQTEDAPATAAAAIGEAPAADVNTSNADETAKVEALQTDQTSADGKWGTLDDTRSEEHTSELQSLMRISYAVFCLNKQHR